jgi:CubicO group peptidase (beta-lactamase class C family)
MKKISFVILLITAVMTCACGVMQDFQNPSELLLDPTQAITASPVPGNEAYWPTNGWRTSSPEDQGMDSALIEGMFEVIDEQNMAIDGVVVVRNGYIVAEQYYPPYTENTRHVLYSCTKSFISALIGIAIADGYIEGIDQLALDFFPERTFANVDTRKKAMTLEDLLTMRSGLDWDEGMPVYQEMMATRDWVGYVLDKPMETDPGSQFRYCSGCSHVMSAILQEVTEVNTLEYARSRLFDPLGIENFHWELDGSGIPNGGWGLEMTPRDMAKFGYLFLNEGTWDRQQIIPADWVKVSTQPGLEVESGVDYAYQWWVYPDSYLYAAQGLYAQKIYVIPDLELVMVFTADARHIDPAFELLEEWIIPAVH